MIVKAKSIYGDPFYLRDVLEVGGGICYVDAAPFYTGVRLAYSVSGNSVYVIEEGGIEYIRETTTYNFSASRTFDRTAIVAENPAMIFTGYSGITGNTDAALCEWAAAPLVPPPEGKCYIHTGLGTDWSHLPVHIIIGEPEYEPEVIGTITTTEYMGEGAEPEYETTTTDILGVPQFLVPRFFRHATSGIRARQNRWGTPLAPEQSVDISGWTLAQWRDLRGAHSISLADPVGGYVSNTITRTYGWEIL